MPEGLSKAPQSRHNDTGRVIIIYVTGVEVGE